MLNKQVLVARLGQSGSYDHFYGHDPDLIGLETINRSGPPAHLVLTLDTTDPFMGELKLNDFPRFRLVFPYRYENRPGAYTQESGRIVFVTPMREASSNWPYRDFPPEFTRVPVALFHDRWFVEPQSPYRMADFPNHPERVIYLGENQTTTQEHRVSCPACGGPSRLLARVPDRADKAAEETWGTSDVFALFWFCDPCGVTIFHNECG